MIVDDVLGSLIESLFNVMLIRCDDFKSLPKHLEASEHRHDVLDHVVFEIASPKLRDSHMEELANRG